MTKEPESPINILAGEKLKIKKPPNAPANANDKAAYGNSLATINQVPKVQHIINPTPLFCKTDFDLQ